MRLFKRRTKRGNQLIEFVLVAPLFLALVFGTVEYGWFFTNQLAVTHAGREAARTAAVAARTEDRAAIAMQTAVARLRAEGTEIKPGEVRARIEGKYPEEFVIVDLRVRHDKLTLLIPLPDTLGAHVVMRLEDQVPPD